MGSPRAALFAARLSRCWADLGGLFPAATSSGKRRLLHLAGFAVSLLCLSYFLRDAVQSGVPDLIQAQDWAMIPLALIPYMLGYAASAGAWHLLLRRVGAPTSLEVSAGTFFTAQFAKYLPGNVAHHVGRVVIAARFGLPARRVAASMLIETATVIGLVLLFSLPLIIRWVDVPLIWDWATAIIAVVTTSCWLQRKRLSRVSERLGLERSAGWAAWIAPVLLSAAGILLSGSSILLLDKALELQPAIAIQIVALFCTAWVAGFLTPGAPAGLGVRELVISQGLAPLIGGADAMSTALLFRALTVTADLLGFVIGLALLRRANARAQRSSVDPSSIPAAAALFDVSQR